MEQFKIEELKIQSPADFTEAATKFVTLQAHLRAIQKESAAARMKSATIKAALKEYMREKKILRAHAATATFCFTVRESKSVLKYHDLHKCLIDTLGEESGNATFEKVTSTRQREVFTVKMD